VASVLGEIYTPAQKKYLCSFLSTNTENSRKAQKPSKTKTRKETALKKKKLVL